MQQADQTRLVKAAEMRTVVPIKSVLMTLMTPVTKLRWETEGDNIIINYLMFHLTQRIKHVEGSVMIHCHYQIN